MKKQVTDFNKSLSIQELEERYELTVAVGDPCEPCGSKEDCSGHEPCDVPRCGG